MNNKISIRELNLPPLISQLVENLKMLFTNIMVKILLHVVIAKLFQLFTSKRIKFDESGIVKLTNWFGLIFLQSGGGKDRLVDTIDNNVLKHFFENYQLDIRKSINNKEMQNTNSDSNLSQNKNLLLNNTITQELNDATPTGIFLLAKSLNTQGFGSINIKLPEFSLYALASGSANIKFTNNFFEYYSCKIAGKVKQGGESTQSITDVPINILAHSDFTLCEDPKIKNKFEQSLLQGSARRFLISFQQPQEEKISSLTDEEERSINETMGNIGKSIYNIFTRLRLNACFVLSPEAKEVLNSYQNANITNSNEEEKRIFKAEIKSRGFKALKLSTLFSALNHPEEERINVSDMQQAISVIEFLSSDYKDFINYRPERHDEYDEVFDFLKKHLNQRFTKTELTTKHNSEIDIRRRDFVASFNKIMNMVSEIALSKGYELVTTFHNNGSSYTLRKPSGVKKEQVDNSYLALIDKHNGNFT